MSLPPFASVPLLYSTNRGNITFRSLLVLNYYLTAPTRLFHQIALPSIQLDEVERPACEVRLTPLRMIEATAAPLHWKAV